MVRRANVRAARSARRGPMQRGIGRVAKRAFGKKASKGFKKVFRTWNKYAPAVSAAYTAGKLAYHGYKYAKSYLYPKRRYGYATGRMAGRMKRPKALKSDPYHGQGYVHTTEIAGVIQDPRCVYVGHGTTVSSYVIEHVAQCLLRKLLDSSGVWRNESVGQVIDSTVDNIIGYVIRYTTKDMSDGTLASHAHTILGGESILGLVGNEMQGVASTWSEFITMLKNYSAGNGRTSATNTIEPMYLDLIMPSTLVIQKRLNLKEEIVHYRVKSTIKIQNRSLASDGSNDAEAVGNNPITGKLYHFSGGNPRTKGATGFQFNGFLEEDAGVLALGASVADVGDAGLREPPDGKFWWNCNKMGKVTIEPGAIKSDTIYWNKTSYLLKFLSTVGRRTSTSTYGYVNVNLPGASAMYALEDVINYNPSYNVLIGYEVNRETAMYLSTHKKRFALGTLYEHNVNYTPA